MEPIIIVLIFDCDSLIESGGCFQLLIDLFSKFYKFSEFTASSEHQRSEVTKYKYLVTVLE